MADLLGIHAEALKFRANRSAVLANNLANADTPGFKARDISFADQLSKSAAASVARTHGEHMTHRQSGQWSEDQLGFRVPTQPAVDGNTVETDVEQAQFAENVVQYRASLMFINGKLTTMRHALTGER